MKLNLVPKYIEPEITDEMQRTQATKSVAKQAWHMVFLPFGALGLFAGWKGCLVGCCVGGFFYLWILFELRYGREL